MHFADFQVTFQQFFMKFIKKKKKKNNNFMKFDTHYFLEMGISEIRPFDM